MTRERVRDTKDSLRFPCRRPLGIFVAEREQRARSCSELVAGAGPVPTRPPRRRRIAGPGSRTRSRPRRRGWTAAGGCNGCWPSTTSSPTSSRATMPSPAAPPEPPPEAVPATASRTPPCFEPRSRPVALRISVGRPGLFLRNVRSMSWLLSDD